MAKITIDKKGQARITIPTDIVQLKGWDQSVEIIFVPFVQEPGRGIDSDTPILLKEITRARFKNRKGPGG